MHPIVPHQTSDSTFVLPAFPSVPGSTKSWRHCAIDCSTIAFASNDTCKTRATSVIVLQGPCTTARVEDVADLSACSRGSSAQCFFFFRIRRAFPNTHNSWSSAPGIFLHPRILLLQRKRARHTSLRRSASITTVPTLILNTQPPTANSLFHTRQTSSGHS